MTKYNYYEAVREDISLYIYENGFNVPDDDHEDELYDELWTEDSVTGNGSGSYTYDRETAREYVTQNTDLCAEALREFCVPAETIAEKFLCEDWEYFDVTIRCYVLGSALYDVLHETKEVV